MRLLIVSHACATAINQQLYAEIERRTGWDLTLVIPSNWRDEYGRVCAGDRWPSFNGEIIKVPVFRSGDIILHTYKVSFGRLIRSISPDVIYVNHEPYAAATAQVYFGNRRCVGSRPIGFYSCQNIFKRYPPPFRWTEAWILRTSQFAFPISAAVESVFREKGYRGISTVIPLATDLSVYYPRDDAATARAELLHDVKTKSAAAINDSTTLIGFIGRFVPEKGLITLIHAVAKLDKQRPWHLVLIGGGPMEETIRNLADREGLADRVSFFGFVPHVQLPRFLSAIDVLVLPSETQSNWREQFGRVILEAMACETPVVGSNSGEIPNLIKRTGGGVVFQERDPVDLASALQQIIADSSLRRRLGVTGRNSVTAFYTIQSAAELFIQTVQATVNTN